MIKSVIALAIVAVIAFPVIYLICRGIFVGLNHLYESGWHHSKYAPSEDPHKDALKNSIAITIFLILALAVELYIKR